MIFNSWDWHVKNDVTYEYKSTLWYIMVYLGRWRMPLLILISGAGTWFATEYDPIRNHCFGYVSIFGDHCDEWGYFSIDELESVRLPFGLRMERDLYWEEKPFSQAVKEL